MSERMRIQCKREKATELPPVQSDTVQNSPFASQQDMDEVPSIVQEVLSSSNGQPLDASTRAFMEPRFGHDFSQVQIHTDERAAESAQAVNALAYTVGRDVVFGQGQYAPGTHTGKHLLAHELTHVVQQSHADGGDQLMVGLPGDSHEQEADVISTKVAADLHSTETTQRAGDVTVASITGMAKNLFIQRAPAASIRERLAETEARLADVEHRTLILEKRQAAMALDLRWRAKFGERMASYRQAILRISGGKDAAAQGFQSAQVAQAQTDALATQLIGGLMVIGFAAGFEWAFSAALGSLGPKLDKMGKDITGEERAKKIIEAVENPANAAASASVNVAGVITSTQSAERGQAPTMTPASAGGGPSGAMAYLASNLEALEHHSQLIEQAFLTRSVDLQGWADAQWEKFDPAAQESTYQRLLDDLKSAGSGVEELKPSNAVALVLERHLWALWIKELLGKKSEPLPAYGGLAGAPVLPEPHFEDIGTDIEVRLNQVGVSEQAGVSLTGHWYSPNSPGNWRAKLIAWANSYSETLKL